MNTIQLRPATNKHFQLWYFSVLLTEVFSVQKQTSRASSTNHCPLLLSPATTNMHYKKIYLVFLG